MLSLTNSYSPSASDSASVRSIANPRRLLIALCGAMLLCLSSVSTGELHGQQDQSDQLPIAAKYKEVGRIDSDAENRRELQKQNRDAKAAQKEGIRLIQNAMESGSSLQTADIKEYVDGYLLPRLTLKKELAKAGQLRDEFDRYFMSSKFSVAARTSFIKQIAVPGLKSIISNKKLSPAARVNAVVMLSQLDESPLVRISRTPPRPSLDAFQELTAIFTNNASEPFLQAPAFSGILRHIEIDTAAGAQRIPQAELTSLTQFVSNMFDTIVKEDPELKDDFKRWKVGRAIDFMSKVRPGAEAPAFFDRLSAVIAADSKAPTWIKLDAVRAIGKLPLTGIAAEKVNATVESIATFASSTLNQQATDIDESVKELIYDNILYDDVDLVVEGTNYKDNPRTSGFGGGMGMGMGGPGMGGMGGMGMGDDGPGMGGPGMGGMGGPGMGGPGMGPGMGGGRGGVVQNYEPPEPVVDLPTYELNLFRRKVKLVVFSVKELFAKDAIQNVVSANHKTAMTALDSVFEEFMEESNVGIVDLDVEVDEPLPGEPPKQEVSVASQLQKVCEQYSADIKDQVAAMRGEAAPVRAKKPDDSAPVGSPFGN